MAKPIVGLTGGIASGKSTVGRLFAAAGCPVIDADQLAREVVEVGTEGLAAVVAEFGTSFLLPDGGLDRKKLAAHVFADPGARARLNAIVHPRIAQAAAQQIMSLQKVDAPFVVYEAALLVENGLHRGFRALVVVAVTPETQLKRLESRDKISESDARARVAAQMPLEEKLKVADYVIWNDGNIEELEARFHEVNDALRARFSADAG